MSGLARVEHFVQVAEKLSFRAAAQHLGVTPTAVSKAVAALEAELGVRLLHRSTRHVALTPEGEVYLRHCREALDRLQAGRDWVTRAQQVAQGRLRVSASFVFGRPLAAALPRLLGRYPRVQVQLTFSDVAVNLVEAEVDVAVRIGPVLDGGLVARRLRTPRWVTVASPGWLAQHPEVREVADLAAHRCLHFAMPSGQLAAWRFTGEEAGFLGSDRVVFDHGDLLVDAAAAGLGVAQVFDFMVADALRRGELVAVLPGRQAPGPPVHALCLSGRQRVPKVRAFLDFAEEVFGGG